MSLLKAAQEGSISKCKQLLEAGSDVGERDKNGFTPLLLAAQECHPGLCELLLKRVKANVEGYSWADEILLDSLLESSNSRRDFDENY